MDVIGGRHRLYVNSEKYYLKGDPTYDVGGMKQSELPTPEKTFIQETYVPCRVSGTIAFVPNLDLVKLRKTRNATVMLECPNGQTIVFPNASFIGDQSVSGGEGDVSFEFVGYGEAKVMMP